MRRRLLLLRHAKSAWDDPLLDDHDRPLAPRGQKAARRLQDHIRQLPQLPDVVVCSSAVRTVQTLDAIRPALRDRTPIIVEDALYLADADTWMSRLRTLDEDVGCAMAIGHNPGLEDLAALLVDDGSEELRNRLAATFPTGALATVSFRGAWSALATGAGRLEALFEPRA